MKARHLIGILCLTLALSCSRAIEPGLYTVQGGYVRVFLDSLGNKKAIMYRDTSALWADTLTFALTKELMGATDAALGNVQPENTSAIIALQQSSAVPLEIQKNALYDFTEHLGMIWLDFILHYYDASRVMLFREDGGRTDFSRPSFRMTVCMVG